MATMVLMEMLVQLWNWIYKGDNNEKVNWNTVNSVLIKLPTRGLGNS